MLVNWLSMEFPKDRLRSSGGLTFYAPLWAESRKLSLHGLPVSGLVCHALLFERCNPGNDLRKADFSALSQGQ